MSEDALVARLERDHIPLEMCPHCNLLTGAVSSLADHPADRLLSRGLAVTINTDGRTTAGTSLDREFALLAGQFGWTDRRWRRSRTTHARPPSPGRKDEDQVLVFDADDTLWENNVRFERVVDDFVAWLAHPTLDDAAIRAVLRDIELANTVTHGYGSRVFLRTLHDCFERLHARPASDGERQEIADLAMGLMEHRVELMPGVAGTLSELGRRHGLALLTKGETDEQQGKLDASGLARFFGSIHIVDEKNVETYRHLTRQLSLRPGSTWMIGNSVKSDIIPARQAGWNAVFIPNEHTWALEHDELDPDDHILHLESFTDLLNHF